MKKVIVFAILMSLSIFAFAQIEDLIISEYIEGSSSNKALEIYNGTGMEVDLSNYVILQNSNSGPIDEYTYWMEGTLANEEVYVFANDAADQVILDQADNLVAGVCWFNGDDYRGLGKIDPNGLYQIEGPDSVMVNISIVDMIGMFPDDPGSGWDVAGVTNATANHTLIRKMEVMEGTNDNDEWLIAAGTDAENSEWIVFDTDTFDYLGVHEEIVIDPANEIVPGSIVINEIMYNTPSYDNEWVELYNTTDQAINLEGAYLLDDDATHPKLTIPEGYEIPAFGYFTVLIDTLGEELTFIPDYAEGAGLWSLGNGGDQVNFYDEADTMIDYTEYDDGGDWPTECDGDGPSLELISPDLDNTLPASWQASWVDGGTPGAENSSAPTDPMITVLYPNGGEVLEIGGEYELSWESLNFSDNVDIYLNAPVRFDIAIDVANTGSYMWTIPTDAPLSEELMLVVEDAVDGDPIDMSDDFFSIIDPSEVPVVVINEIMYNPPSELGNDDAYEYLELFNPGEEAIDMTGWYFTEGIDYTFAERFILEAGAYAVLAVNPDSLFSYYGVTAVGQFSGALSNGGEDIILVTADSVQVDYVEYDDGGDWPTEPDGDGASLELTDPELDNSLAANWHASYEMYGTPGAENSMPTSSIGWGNLQWPYSIQLVVGDTTETIYGQVWVDGVTNGTGQGAGVTAQVGYGADGSTPGDDWNWFNTEYNADNGNNDEYMGVLFGMEEGVYDYTYRYIYEGDTMWYYPTEIGDLTVVAAPPEEVQVTFAVDMQYQEVSENGVHIAGSFQGWDPGATEMLDEDMDMVYEVTMTLLSGEYHEYKYVNGNAWGGDEANNRSLTVPEEDTILPAVLFNDWFPVVDGVFFSEYIEGSSNNKAIEIYNATGDVVDLANFRIAQAVNGGGWAYYHTFPEGAMLAADDVWVIITDSVDPSFFDAANADEVLSYPSVVHHNGDDARGLEYSLDGENWAMVDIIGNPDEDPGSGWAVAGIADATKDHTLVRKGFVTAGNTDWTASAGTGVEDSEWEVYDQNTFDYLGYHGEAPDLEVTFNVNMNYQIELGNFVDTSFVDIGANFNQWGADPMVCEDIDMDGIYTYTTMLPLGYNCEFKFRINGNWDLAEFPGGPNRTYVVVDGENVFDCWFSDEEPPVVTTQDVTVTFSMNMEFIDPASYAGGISIQGSVAPLSWDAGVNLLTPARETYTIDILFPAGSNMEVEFKFAMLAEGATDWVWESVENRMFTIDDTQTTQILPEIYWDDFVLVTIPEIQMPVDSTDVSPYLDQVVTTQGIVTAATESKYWIETAEGGAWSGLYVYDPVNTPMQGDCIRITGTIGEYYNLTEIFDITGYELMSSGNELPLAEVITTNQLATEEQWESVLVMLENVIVTQEANNYGEWYMDDGTGECQADDALYHVEPLVNDEFVSVTGLVNYSYGSYEMLPRYEEDLVTGPQWLYGDVTADWNVDAFDAANMLQYAVQLDPIGAPLPWTWQLIAGDVDGNEAVEAYDAALVLQYSVDLIDVFPVEELRGITNPVANLDVSVENNELVFKAAGDFYSAVITVNSKAIELTAPVFSQEVLNAVNSDKQAIAIASAVVLSGEFMRLPFDVISSNENVLLSLCINGINSELEVDSQELETNDAPVVNELLGNYPNPFNPVTNINLSVADNATSVSVKIFNIKGQLVKSLFQGKLDSGYHSLAWNGFDKNNQPAGSGVYFYSVQIGEYRSMNKMLMLK